MEYISLGMQCTSAVILDFLGKRSNSYPFDWAFTYPRFLNFFIKELYCNHDIDYLCDLLIDINNNDTYATLSPIGCEHYITVKTTKPKNIYNKKYKITFPHNEYNQQSIYMIKRRIKKLYDCLLNENNYITFFYVSAPNKNRQYSIDGEILTENVSLHLNSISEFLSTKRDNFRIIFIDCLGESTLMHEKIIKLNIAECESREDVEKYCKENLILDENLPRFKL